MPEQSRDPGRGKPGDDPTDHIEIDAKQPLAVLIVTIAGGAVFGAVGLILAAPLTSAAVRISGDLARAKAEIKSSPGAAGPEPAATQT